MGVSNEKRCKNIINSKTYLKNLMKLERDTQMNPKDKRNKQLKAVSSTNNNGRYIRVFVDTKV